MFEDLLKTQFVGIEGKDGHEIPYWSNKTNPLPSLDYFDPAKVDEAYQNAAL